MTQSKSADEQNAISTILTRTQRLLQAAANGERSAFHQAQLLLSEYIVMLTDTQLENSRLRKLLGSYARSRPAAKNLSASTVIAEMQKRIRALQGMVATLRGALEKIQACEAEAAERSPREIAAHALRAMDEPGNDAAPKH